MDDTIFKSEIAVPEDYIHLKTLNVNGVELFRNLIPIVPGNKAPTRYVGRSLSNKAPYAWKNGTTENIDENGLLFTYRNPAGKQQMIDTRSMHSYGLGLKLGPVLAIDCDSTDPVEASAIHQILSEVVGHAVPTRRRENVAKWAVLVAIEGRPSLPSGGAGRTRSGKDIELRGEGSQQVLIGSNNGSIYYWTDGKPGDHVTLSDEQFMTFCDRCTSELGIVWGNSPLRDGGKHRDTAGNSWSEGEYQPVKGSLFEFFQSHGMVRQQLGSKAYVVCPWESEHSGASGASSTALFGEFDGHPEGFCCLHAHCQDEHRDIYAVRAWARQQGWEDPELAGFFSENLDRTTVGNAQDRLRKILNRTRQKSTVIAGEKVLYNIVDRTFLQDFLSDPVLCGEEIAYDDFLFTLQHRRLGETEWQPFHPDSIDIGTLGRRIEEATHDNTGNRSSMIYEVVREVGHRNRKDMLKERIAEIPEWDGVDRLSRWLTTYVRTADDNYASLLGTYIIRACESRWSDRRDPETGAPVPVDIFPVLFGPQGPGKSRLVQALSILGPKYMTDKVAFNVAPDRNLRQTRGKCVAEIAELGGAGKKDQNEMKMWITCTTDDMTEKYEKENKAYVRRWMPVVTTNDHECLFDPTGSRRFAPIEVAIGGTIDVDGVREILPALVAQARYLNDREPLWKLAQKIIDVSKDVRSEFYDSDALEDKVLEFAKDEKNKDGFTLVDLHEWLMNDGSPDFKKPGTTISRKDQHRYKQILTHLGIYRKSIKINGTVVKKYVLPATIEPHAPVAEDRIPEFGEEIPF